MSTLAVEVCSVDKIEPIEKADSLELLYVKGWCCVAQKDAFKVGDLCVYFPIDSILTEELENRIFGLESKIRLEKHRIRTIKLRGQISQGLVTKFDTLGITPRKLGDDLTKELGVTKHEPPLRTGPQSNIKQASKKQVNPLFRKYTDIENFKNHVTVFEEGEQVSITEKVHGSNVRFAYLPTAPSTLWKKILKFIGMLPAYEICIGSHNVQLQDKGKNTKTFHGGNIYREMFDKYEIEQYLAPGWAFYGEVYGSSVQGGYMYGCKEGERKLCLFDIMVDGVWMDAPDFQVFCRTHGLPMVPELYRGPFNAEAAKALTAGNSVIAPTQKVREGVVIKPLKEEHCRIGRKVLKLISDEYLLVKGNTDFH
jgi:RNA ligase (TIGR02306 family)